MEVTLAALADGANIAPGGKLNLLGVFDTIGMSRFPGIHGFMVLALRLRLNYEDGGKKHSLEVTMVDVDGKEIMHARNQLMVNKISPGEYAHTNHILNFVGTTYNKPGRFVFKLKWDGELTHEVHLKVAKTQPPGSKK